MIERILLLQKRIWMRILRSQHNCLVVISHLDPEVQSHPFHTFTYCQYQSRTDFKIFLASVNSLKTSAFLIINTSKSLSAMSNLFFQNRQLCSVGSFKEKKPCNTNNQKTPQKCLPWTFLGGNSLLRESPTFSFIFVINIHVCAHSRKENSVFLITKQ